MNSSQLNTLNNFDKRWISKEICCGSLNLEFYEILTGSFSNKGSVAQNVLVPRASKV